MSTAAFAGNGKILKHARPVPNNYIVRIVAVPTAEVENTVRAIAKDHGIMLNKRRGTDAIMKYAMQGFGALMSEAKALALATDSRVELVEQDAWISSSTTDYFSDSDPKWHLDRIDQSGPVQSGLRSYTYQTTGSGVYIYVLDAGVERNHIEFDNDNDPSTPQTNPRVLDGPAFSSDGYSATNPCPTCTGEEYRAGTHGTAVASIAAGKNVGVAKTAYIVPVKVMNYAGTARLEWLCWGLDWIATPWNGDFQSSNPYPKSPAVCNISMFYNLDDIYQYDDWASTPLSSFEHTVNNVVSAGITVVTSANNQADANGTCRTSPARMAYTNGGPPNYFASPKRTISVGGTDDQDRLWRCATTGECAISLQGSNTGPCVDLYAPAHNIKVAMNTSYAGYRAANNSGTSFSAPIVAGIAARLLQTNPLLTPQQVWAAIQARAIALPANFDGDGISANDRLAFISPNE